MPSVNDWIQTPLSTINSLFEESVSKPDYKSEQHLEQVKQFFSSRLSPGTSLLATVPSLNDAPLDSLAPTSLVRYRCMVQDMFDPEYFLGVYEVEDVKRGNKRLQSGMFKDVAECKPHENVLYESCNNQTMDRQTLYCVPIPGENCWTKQAFSAQTKVVATSSSVTSRTKRSRDDEDDSENMESTSNDTKNRATTETEERMEDDTGNGEIGDTAASDASRKKPKTEEKRPEKLSAVPDLNFPLVGEKGPACLVKLYDSCDGLKVNDMVEFIGVLSSDPSMAEFPDDSKEKSSFVDPVTMEIDSVEQQAHHPPPSLVPRLHVIQATKLSHSNPLLPREVNTEVIEHNQEVRQLLQESHTLRGQLIEVLQQALYGDSLAAEYLLCHLVSTVYARRDVLALGQFSVNLSGCPRATPYSTHLGGLLSHLVTKSHILPLTVDNLNSQKFSPKKDYNANRLTSGQLQLSDHTHLMVDETAMQPGQLDAEGVRNLTAIGNLITWQKVEYDFSFHRQDFPANVGVLVLSEGKSMLKCDCQLSLSPKQHVVDLDSHFKEIYSKLSDENLRKVRMYLGLMQQLPYSLSEELQKEIENDFVSARKENPEKMTVDDFHKLLVLARLVCISHGETSMNKQMWEKTKLLEMQRKQRLQSTALSA